MKNLNKKGFTLIELLAVIVILGVLLTLAAPAVSKYINSSKKSTYIVNVKNYADSVRSSALNGEYAMPVNANHATLYTFGTVYDSLEKGGKTSPYGKEFDLAKSFVIIVNEGTPEAPKYRYYISAVDNAGYGIGQETDGSISAAAINYDDLKESNIVQLGNASLTPEEAGTTPVAIAGVGSVTIDSVNKVLSN